MVEEGGTIRKEMSSGHVHIWYTHISVVMDKERASTSMRYRKNKKSNKKFDMISTGHIKQYGDRKKKVGIGLRRKYGDDTGWKAKHVRYDISEVAIHILILY